MNNINPSHYQADGMQAIDAANAMAEAWQEEMYTVTNCPNVMQCHCMLTAFKYIWRAPLKGDWKENVRKAIWYLQEALGENSRGGMSDAKQAPIQKQTQGQDFGP